MVKIVAFLVVLIPLLQSCSGWVKKEERTDASNGKTIERAGFRINHYGSFKVLTVYNPWQRAEGVEMNYLLYKR